MNNININSLEKLSSPYDIKNNLNIIYEDSIFIQESRTNINKYLNKNNSNNNLDNKLVLFVGPCSIHNYDECIEYAKFIKKSIKKYKNLFIVMRLYFEKPRTIKGWKGYLYDPLLDNSNNIKFGIYNTRKLLIEITKMRIPIATEFLDTIIPQYIDDLITWGCIGARTVESQLHRQLASGLSMFIGFKNRTDGNIDIAVNAMISAHEKHSFFGIDINGKAAIIHTNGNKNTALILRGSTSNNNINIETLEYSTKLLKKNNLNNNIIIDLSHGNTIHNGEKNYKKQIDNINLILSLKKQFCNITALMIESNINEDNQDINNKPLKYGISVTDKCINIDDTDDIFKLLNNL